MTSTPKNLGRRSFLGHSGALALSALAAPFGGGASAATGSGKLKIAMVGTGSRGTATWGRNLMRTHSDYVELVGFCDINAKRVANAPKLVGVSAPTFEARRFDRMRQTARRASGCSWQFGQSRQRLRGCSSPPGFDL